MLYTKKHNLLKAVSQLLNSICDMWLMVKKVMFRGKVDEELDRLARLIGGIKRQNLSDVLQEALENWVNLSENQQIIERHNLRDNTASSQDE